MIETMEEYTEEIDPIVDGIFIESVKVDLNKCGVNGGLGIPNVFGRRVHKSLVFPVAKLNYSGSERFNQEKFNKTVDLKDAGLTATNYEGVGCGMTYFIVSNSRSYSLYDINGHFIRYISIAKYGKIVCLGVYSFITKSEDSGIMHIWTTDGKCWGDIPASPENIKRYCWQKGKLIKKSEAFRKGFPKNEDLYI